MPVMRYCSKCGKSMAEVNFYTLPNKNKCELCKACLTMHVDNWNPETFLWILEKFDIPWLPWEWERIRDQEYQKDPYKMTGMSVFGRYLAKTKLTQYIDKETRQRYTWKDSEMLQQRHAEAIKKSGDPVEMYESKLAEMKLAYENGEISQEQFMTYQKVEGPPPTPSPDIVAGGGPEGRESAAAPSPYPINDHPFEEVDLPDLSSQLTEDDKIYLALKWGRFYTTEEWIALEQLYVKYDKSFSLHNVDLIAGTKQLCKLDLKSNAALDTGDFDTYSKLAKASDSLRKSLKFTEAQRKEERGAEFSSIGQIVAFCEKNNPNDFISPIDLTVDRDVADKDLHNIKNFTANLVHEDPAIWKMIEQYIKKREILMNQEKNKNKDLVDDDLTEHNSYVEEQRQEDNNVIYIEDKEGEGEDE